LRGVDWLVEDDETAMLSASSDSEPGSSGTWAGRDERRLIATERVAERFDDFAYWFVEGDEIEAETRAMLSASSDSEPGLSGTWAGREERRLIAEEREL
jgi:hypothetical protein